MYICVSFAFWCSTDTHTHIHGGERGLKMNSWKEKQANRADRKLVRTKFKCNLSGTINLSDLIDIRKTFHTTVYYTFSQNSHRTSTKRQHYEPHGMS